MKSIIDKPRSELKAIVDKNKKLLFQKSIASSTASGYKRAYSLFLQTMNKLNNPIQLNQSNLIDYICARFETGVVVGTMMTELSGIIHHFVTQTGKSFVINKLDTPLLIRAIKGYSNIRGGNPDIRIAISSKQLSLIISNINKSNESLKLMYIAALSLSFWGMLRASEYTYNSTYPLDYLLRNEHIAIKKSEQTNQLYIWYKVPFSKTNKDKEKPIIIACVCKNFKSICAVHHIMNYLNWRNTNINYKWLQPTNAFFIFRNNNNRNKYPYSPLNYSFWCQYFKNVLSPMIKAEQGSFTPHSMRIGGATNMYANGGDKALIMKTGRWQSDCWMRYIRLSPDDYIYAWDSIFEHDKNNTISIPPIPDKGKKKKRKNNDNDLRKLIKKTKQKPFKDLRNIPPLEPTK